MRKTTEDKLLLRARDTIKNQMHEIQNQQATIIELEKIIKKLQNDLEQERKMSKLLKKELAVTQKNRDVYLRAYKASKLAEDITAKHNQVMSR